MRRREFLFSALVAPTVASTLAHAAKRQRAVVLGGGGPVGEAWECGLLHGLSRNGVDLARADLIVGTSAGAIVGARLASGGAAGLMNPEVLAPPESFGPPPPPDAPPGPRDMAPFVSGIRAIASDKCPACIVRSQLGAWALKVEPLLPENAFVESFRQRIPGSRWPTRFECVAINASTGLRQVWSQRSGVAPALALASSGAVPGLFAPVTIGAQRYIDGGLFSPTNADLASGSATVVIVAPTLGQRDEVGRLFARAIWREKVALGEKGAHAMVIAPDAPSLAAFGPDLGDSRRRKAAADAGVAQGEQAAEQMRALWMAR